MWYTNCTTFSAATTVNKDSLANKLVREILARIFAGEYTINSRLPPERALGDEFSISRGTVRQALGMLAALGVISTRHGSGAYVQSLSQFGIPMDYLPREIAKVNLEDILCAARPSRPLRQGSLRADIRRRTQRNRETDRPYGGEHGRSSGVPQVRHGIP